MVPILKSLITSYSFVTQNLALLSQSEHFSQNLSLDRCTMDKTPASNNLSENLDKTLENISITGIGVSTSDNSSTSAQASSSDNSSNSALSQLLADYTPQITPIATSKKPRARLHTSYDCFENVE